MSVVVESSSPSPPSLRDEMRALGRSWAKTRVELVHPAVALDASGEWIKDGARSCARWIADALDIEECTVREWLRVGKALLVLSDIAEAFTDGTLSFSKVRALTRVAEQHNEADLLAIAIRTPAGRLAHAIAAYLRRTVPADELARRQHAARALRRRLEPDGMTATTVRLPPDLEATFAGAVDAHMMRRTRDAAASAQATGSWPTIAQQRADALIDLFEHGGTTFATEVVVHVRGNGCTLDNGTPISDHAVARMLDRAFIRALIHDAERRPINASGRQRHPTDRQKRVVHERDGGRCVDCGSRDLLQYDHDPDWEQSQHTVVDELQLRCARCHQKRHE